MAEPGASRVEARPRPPVHLWIVGVLALLWNAMGAFDYTVTQLRWEPYMSEFSEEQLAYFYGFPSWVVAAWAIAVWGSLLGSILLLLRSKWAVAVFGISILGLAATSVHNFVLTDGAAVMGDAAVIFSVVIWLVAGALWFYAWRMEARGVLT